MKVYNFVKNKNVLALFPTLRTLLAADMWAGWAWQPGWANNCRLHSTKLSTSVLQMLWLFLHLTLF